MYPTLLRQADDSLSRDIAILSNRWFLGKSALGGSGLRLSDREAISPSSHRTGSGRCEDVSNLEKRSTVPDKASLFT